MEPLCTEYLISLRRRDLAPGTIQHRRRLLAGFSSRLEPRSVLDATSDDVERFIAQPTPRSTLLHPRTRCGYISHLSSFYTWCVDRELVATDPTARIDRPRLRQTLPRPISDADLTVALAVEDPMMMAWFWLASHAGLRCGEIASLDGPDVDPALMTLRVLGKGRKERVVPMHPGVLLALRGHGMIPRSGPVFRRPCGGHWSGRQVSRHANEILHGLGIDDTMHQLRHWFGTRALEVPGSDLRAV